MWQSSLASYPCLHVNKHSKSHWLLQQENNFLCLMWQRRLARVVAGHVYFPRKQTFQVTLVVANVTQDGDQGGRGPGWLLANVQSMKTRLTRLPRTSSQLQSSTHHHQPSPTSPPPKEKQNPVFLWPIFKRTHICYNSKTASQMHVAPPIAVHCWQYAPDVVPDIPRLML